MFHQPNPAEERADAAFDLVLRLCLAATFIVPAVIWVMKS